MQLEKRLATYCKHTEGAEVKIAATLCLASVYTIKAWLRKSKVPSWHRDKLATFLEGEKNGNTTVNK